MSEQEHSDQELVQHAEMRAKITAYLRKHRGEHTVGETATALNADTNLVGKILADMAENKQVNLRREGPAKKYSIGPLPEIAGATGVALKPGKDRSVRVSMKELEIEVAGFVITLTKNPTNGRARIIIDESK